MKKMRMKREREIVGNDMDNLVQTSFDYDVLTSDSRVFLQEKADSIRTRLKRTADDIIVIGYDLQAAQDHLRVRYGLDKFFASWIEAEFDMSRMTAYRFINVAKRFGENRNKLLQFSASVIYELASPSTPDTVVEKVQTGEIESSLDAIREAKEELRKAQEAESLAREAEQNARLQIQQTEENARMQTQLLQQQLFQANQAKSTSESQITYLTQQIERLKQEIASISRPEAIVKTEVKEVIPDEVKVRLERMQSKVKELTEQRDNLAQESARLAEAAQSVYELREEQMFRDKLRQQWRSGCLEVTNAMRKLLTGWPSPQSLEYFEGDDWAYLSQVESTMQSVISACHQLNRQTSQGMVVDALEA